MFGFGFFAFLNVIWMTILSIVFIALWVIYSLGFYKLAKNRGRGDAWLAWVPIAQSYLLGRIIPTFDLYGNKLERMHIVLPVFVLGCCLLSQMWIVGFLFFLMLYAGLLLVHYALFRQYKPLAALGYAVLWPVGMFLIKDEHFNAP